MNAQQLLRQLVEMGNFIVNSYLADLSDAEVCMRPVPQANTIAWQLGHLICSTNGILSAIDPTMAPKLPDGFQAAYGKESVGNDDPAKLHPKSVYLDLFAKQKNVACQIIERMTEADLDTPGPEAMRAYAPNYGAMLHLCGTHLMLHAGQIVVLRRKLGKPIVM